MATEFIHGTLVVQPAATGTQVPTRTQVEAWIATAQAFAANLANATGSLTSGQISDFATAADARVNAAISALVDGAPATLDTLNELAAALQDNPDAITDIINQQTTNTTTIGDHETRLDAVEAAQGSSAGHFKQTIGDAAATTFTVNHALSSTDVHVSVFKVSDGSAPGEPITRDANNVYLDFGSYTPTAGEFRVLVSQVP